MSLSIGIVTIDDWNKSLPVELFLKEADDALYQAKADGRNRVASAVAMLDIADSRIASVPI